MKTIFALLAVVVLATASPRTPAQEVLAEPSIGDFGAIPEPAEDYGDELAPQSVVGPATAGGDLPERIEPVPAGESGEASLPFSGAIFSDSMRYFDACPSLFESSGTWLRRGYWFGEFDYVLFSRTWSPSGDGILLMFEAVQITDPQTGLNVNPAFGGFNSPLLARNELRIKNDKPGAEGMGRVTLGRFLFRDWKNRDHVSQVTWFGGGNFGQFQSLEAQNALTQPGAVNKVNAGFNGALASQFIYASYLDSIEWNYLVKRRMGRDRVEMQPTGEWVRKATASRYSSFLTGLRFINLRETLEYDASDIVVSTNPTVREDGFNNVTIDNDLLGAQIGGSMGVDTARWSFAASVKGGTYWNSMDLNSQYRIGESTVVSQGGRNRNEDTFSFVGEGSLTAKWHLRPNVSIRAGMEMLYIEGVGLAPDQISFAESSQLPIHSGGGPIYLGSSLGFEMYR